MSTPRTRCLFGVTVFQTVQAYPRGSYELQVAAFGAVGATELAQAEEAARGKARRWTDLTGRVHRFEVERFCHACEGGRVPGTKRTPCLVCSGEFVTPVLSGREMP